MADFGSALSAFASLLVALLMLAALAFVSVWLMLMPLISPLLAWANRLGEFRADRTAMRLGYGPALAGVLRGWIALERGQPRPRLLARMVASHPPHGERIRRLEQPVIERKAGGGW